MPPTCGQSRMQIYIDFFKYPNQMEIFFLCDHGLILVLFLLKRSDNVSMKIACITFHFAMALLRRYLRELSFI